jgi:hypothetical protein
VPNRLQRGRVRAARWATTSKHFCGWLGGRHRRERRWHKESELAEQSRHDAADEASASAERASVLIAGPLGLCYLPAFVCLGIVPVVAGLAGDVLGSGIL